MAQGECRPCLWIRLCGWRSGRPSRNATRSCSCRSGGCRNAHVRQYSGYSGYTGAADADEEDQARIQSEQQADIDAANKLSDNTNKVVKKLMDSTNALRREISAYHDNNERLGLKLNRCWMRLVSGLIRQTETFDKSMNYNLILKIASQYDAPANVLDAQRRGAQRSGGMFDYNGAGNTSPWTQLAQAASSGEASIVSTIGQTEFYLPDARSFRSI